MKKNLRGAYLNFAHDRSEDWNWLRDWQPSVVRLMLPGSHTDPNSVDVQRIRRVYETAPDALIVLRVWDVDDRNGEAHRAMAANPTAEAGKQLDWWARVFDRVTVPRGHLIAGLNNEVNPHTMGAPLYAYTERACLLGTQREIRLGCGVFSVGNPGKPGESPFDMTYFARLEDVMLLGDHVWLLHEYMQPEGMYAVWTDGTDGFQQISFSFRFEFILQFLRAVKMICNSVFPRCCHKNHICYACPGSFFHGILNQGFIDNRNHFLWNSFCSRKETGAHPANRENRFTDRRSHRNAFRNE